ncbi:MAG: hypothetical protein IGS03_08750 [Candidatus Sericytochromatia bacterium]|nr:hypothetical protein [Candidatus Sericytochromatia bacterium]
MSAQRVTEAVRQGLVPNRAAELKLDLHVPGFLKKEQPLSVSWQQDPALCQLLWQWFQNPAEPLTLTAEQMTLLTKVGLLLAPEHLPLYAVNTASEGTASVLPYPLPVNPGYRVFNMAARLHLVVLVPLRRQPLSCHTLDLQIHVEACQTIWRFFTRPEQGHWSSEEMDSLVNYGLLCQPQQLSQPVPYLPRLDRGDALAPYPDRLTPLPEALSLNPAMHWQLEAALPEAVKLPALRPPMLAHVRPLLWVQVPQNLVWTPFALSSEHQTLLKSLQADPAGLETLSPYMRRQFFEAGILRPADSAWQPFAELSDSLVSDDFCVIRGLLNPAQIAGFRHYLRAMEYEGQLQDGDTMVPHRLCRHNEPLCRWFQQQFYPVIARLTDLDLKPSYCYLAVYHSGAALARHTDREQCAWNLSLVLDMQPAREAQQAWPIYLETAAGVQEVRLEMGDGILYRGDRYPHWRPPLPPQHRVAVCFFHFVEAGFEGLLD